MTVEISASLFDIQEASDVSRERVNQLKSKIVKRYKEKIESRDDLKNKDSRHEVKEQGR